MVCPTQFWKLKDRCCFCSLSLHVCTSFYTSGDLAGSFKELIQNSQRHKEVAPELTTGMLYCTLAHFPVSGCLRLSDPSHLHPTRFEYGHGNSNITTCAR